MIAQIIYCGFLTHTVYSQAISCDAVKSVFQTKGADGKSCCDGATSVDTSSCTIAADTYNAEMAQLKAALKHQMARKNPLPLQWKFTDESKYNDLYGYTTTHYNAGDAFLIGAPFRHQSSMEAEGATSGRIVVKEKLFGTTWFNMGEVTVPASADAFGFGRYVASNADGSLILQSSWNPSNPGFTSLHKREPTDPARQAKFTIPAFTKEYLSGPNWRVTGLDGTYTIGDNLYGGDGSYAETPLAVWEASNAWLGTFGGTISVTASGGKVTSITISGADNGFWWQSDIDALEANGLVEFTPPPHEYSMVGSPIMGTQGAYYNSDIASDGSRFTRVFQNTTNSNYFQFDVYSVEDGTITKIQSIETGNLCKSGNQYSVITKSTLVTHCNNEIPVVHHYNNVTGVYDRSTPLHTRTRSEWKKVDGSWRAPGTPFTYEFISTITISDDAEMILVGDRWAGRTSPTTYDGPGLVEVYVRNTDGSYALRDSIHGDGGNFPGQHKSLSISPDKTMIGIGARAIKLESYDWFGAAYLYKYSPDKLKWIRVADVPSPLFANASFFGQAIDVSDTSLIVSTMNMLTDDKPTLDFYEMAPDVDSRGLLS